MALLHDETRARWTNYPPEKFIREVINRALRDKINVTYTMTHVYTQVVYRLPATTSVWVPPRRSGENGAYVRLRDLFVDMRTSATRMLDIIQDSTETLPLDYTYITYIQQVIAALREHVVQLRYWTEAIRQDENADLCELRHLNGKSVQAMAADIAQHIKDISNLLDFTQEYTRKFTRSA
jgi:hypothetical protein